MQLAGELDLLAGSRSLGAPLQHSTRVSGRKKRRYAYLAWLCLGSHYLYLGRPVVQALFWLTGGGLLLWWLIDFFRIGDLVRRRNRLALRKLLDRLEAALERRVRQLETEMPVAAERAPCSALGSTPEEREGLQVWSARPARSWTPARAGDRRRTGAAVIVAFCLAAACASYVLNPPPLYPPALEGPSFRTLRQVNVRARPSTRSPVRAVIADRTLLSGSVEGAAGATTRWLRIDRGRHAGGYVALENLEPR